MNRSKLSNFAGASVLALGLLIVPFTLPAAAQTDTTTVSPSPTVENTQAPTLDTTPFQETKNDNNNLGWLGLLGLIGIANLFRKSKRAEYRTTDEVAGRTTTRY